MTDNHKKILEEWKKLCSDHEYDYVNDGGIFISKSLDRMEKEVKEEYKGKTKREWYQQGYKEGRQSVLNELEEEEKKLLQGFRYKKTKSLKKEKQV